MTGRWSFLGARWGVARAGAYLLLSAYALSSILTFAWFITVSLKSEQEFFGSNPWSLPGYLRFQNYVDAWRLGEIGSYFGNSVIVTTVSVCVGIALSANAAYVLARVEFPGRGAVFGLFGVGLMIPAFLVVIPLFFLLKDLGLLGSLWGLCIVYVASSLPFNTLVLTGFFRTLPDEIEEAAYVDGCSPLRAYLSVMLPMATPAVVALAVLQTLWLWNELFFALVFISDPSKFTVPVGLLQLGYNTDRGGGWTLLFAGLVISIVPVLALFALAQERIIRASSGALKG